MTDETSNPGDAFDGSALGDLFEARCIELTETAEEIVVHRQVRLVEEIILRRRTNERVETIPYTLHHTEAGIETIESAVEA